MNTSLGNRRLRLLAILNVAALCLLPAVKGLASTITKTDDTEIKIKSLRWNASERMFYLTRMDGSTTPLPKSSIKDMDIDEPPMWAVATQQLKAKNYDAALSALGSIASDYLMQGWDARARGLMAEIYTIKGDAKKAIIMIEEIPKADRPPEANLAYWKALLQTDRGPALKKELEDTIASGSREMAAAAYLMRGELNRTTGQKEAAVLDFLRVVIMFENVKALQPEALFKAAKVLDDLRDPRADELRTRLKTMYPGSIYANESKVK